MGFASGVPAPPTPVSHDARCAEEEEEEAPSCRVCWTSDGEFLSPCKCSGTQKHVHLKCLRRWQENVQKRNVTDERARVCSVCCATFSVPPLKTHTPGTGVAVQTLRGLGGALCVAVLAFGLTGPPWPHLALLLLLLLGSRSHWLPGLALLMAATLLAGLHARGLRVVLRVDGVGRLGVALIRHGAPVAGISPGVLLVASEGLDHSTFQRSVVLLYQHDREGTRGVILNQPMAHPPTLPAGLAAAAAVAGSQGQGTGADGEVERRGGDARHADGTSGGAASTGGVALKHFLGGPVGMPGEGLNHEVVVLHSVAGVAGSHRILPRFNRTATGGARVGGAGTRAAAAAVPEAAVVTAATGAPLYEGGSLSEVLAKAADAAAAAAAASAAAAGRRGAAGQGKLAQAAAGEEHAAAGAPVLLFHGLCAWAEGQLAGELRAGSWSYTTAELSPDVLRLLSLPHDRLWHTLAGSPSLIRMR